MPIHEREIEQLTERAMASDTRSAPSALSFPRETFAKLQPDAFLLAHLKPASAKSPPTRPSGRAPYECRTPTINTGSLTHSSGSAVVRVGDTAVVCGIRAEILNASDIPQPYRQPVNDHEESTEIEELGLLVPNLELSTGCSPAHLPGNPPSTIAQSLSQRILSLLHISKLLDPKDFRIQYQEPITDEDVPDAGPIIVTKAYWTLYIETLFISLDGNAFDAAWAAILAALKDVKLPHAWWDADREMVLCSDKTSEAKRLQLRGLPIASTFAVFSTASSQKLRSEAECWVLADPDGFEEELCHETVTVVVTRGNDGKRSILRIEKNGGAFVDIVKMRELVAQAADRWSDWEGVLMQDER